MTLALFWVAAILTLVGQVLVLRRDLGGGIRDRTWAIFPAVGLVILLWATWIRVS